MKIKDFITQADTATAVASESNAKAADLARQAAIARTDADHADLAASAALVAETKAVQAAGGIVFDPAASVVYTVSPTGTLVKSPVVTVDAEVREEPAPVEG